MSVELWILAATAVLAVVAISAAVVAVRAARAMSRPAVETPAPPAAPEPTGVVTILEPMSQRAPADLAPQVIEGRLIVPPTEGQVVQATLGRPGVRLSMFAHGVAHAMRAESRDRISALMRREYRRRRRERLQAGRRAVRAAQPVPPSDQWLGS